MESFTWWMQSRKKVTLVNDKKPSTLEVLEFIIDIDVEVIKFCSAHDFREAEFL